MKFLKKINKNKKKIFLFLILYIFYWIFKDYKKIDIYFVNQSKVTYDIKNVNSNFLKKIHRLYNQTIENILVSYFETHKNYWNLVEGKDDKFPEYKFVERKKKLTVSNGINPINTNNWERSHGNNFSNRFSNLKKINNKNASNLEIAWTFEMKEHKGDIQANPIIVDGIIYTPIAGGYIVAIDGKSGKLIWKSDKFTSSVARRGLVYHKNQDDKIPRLIFSNRERLISLNADNGKFIKSFDGDGQVRTGLNVTTPVIYKDNIIIVTWDRAIEVYDLYSGKTKWKFKYLKEISKRYGGKKFNNDGSNSWGGISLDENRGILYFTTGNPHYYFDGTQRPGSNPNSCSLIAIDLEKKKILWSFQETSHDIWNSDLPAPPILTSITKNNKKIDVVVTPTKRSNTLILDRITGEPIFDFRLRKAPKSKLPGEKTSRYQPDLEIPEPFGRNIFKKDDLWSYDLGYQKEINKKYKNFNFGFYEPYSLQKKTLQYNFNGGAEWMGGSIDHAKGIMYVTSNNTLWETGITEIEDNKSLIPNYSSNFTRALDINGYPVIKPPWGSLTALNLNDGKIIWQVPFGEFDYLKKLGIPKTGTENFGGVTATAGNIAIATGTLDKKVYVFDSKNGEILFQKKLPFIGSAPPSTYLYEGEQYFVLHSSGGSTLKKGYPNLVEDGNVLIAFKLKE
ncbi:outer membrane protein assembly factor BamB family protein [Candidatus Pelagibacter sp.]|uniref:outer membrane protein assembly factor BamB family protein n=1 Tax=Candidatus Pelagibacter sp. TaxID=2024849 RepID=UPI003F8424B1